MRWHSSGTGRNGAVASSSLNQAMGTFSWIDMNSLV